MPHTQSEGLALILTREEFGPRRYPKEKFCKERMDIMTRSALAIAFTVTSLFLPEASQAGYQGSVDRVTNAANGTTTLPCYGDIRIDGWTGNTSGSGIRIPASGQFDQSAFATTAVGITGYRDSVNDIMRFVSSATKLGMWRQDVANAYGRSDFGPSGFVYIGNLGINVCPVGFRSIYATATWTPSASPQLSGYGVLNIVRNETLSTPGTIAGLDMAQGLGTLSGSVTLYGDTTNYVNNYSQASFGACAQANGADAVWSFTTTAQGAYAFSTANSGFDTVLYVVRASDNAVVACNDDSAGQGLTSRIDAVLAAGTYYVVLDGYGSTAKGSFNLFASWSGLLSETFCCKSCTSTTNGKCVGGSDCAKGLDGYTCVGDRTITVACGNNGSIYTGAGGTADCF
jgi:Bacterial pre-peptidase C-terminal domain